MRKRARSSSSDDSSDYSELSDVSELSAESVEESQTVSFLLVGTDTGVLKEVAFPTVGECKITRSHGEQKKDCEISLISRVGNSSGQTLFVRGGHELVLFDVEKFEEVKMWFFQATVLALAPEGEGEAESGAVRVVAVTDSSTEIYSFPLTAEEPVLVSTHPKAASVACIGACSVHLAFSDSPNPVQLDKSGNFKWTAKNQPDTALQLTAKFEITAMAEISDSSFLVCGSKQGSVRVFNPALQRKCVSEISKVMPDVLGGGLSHSAVQRVQSVGNARVAISDCTGQALLTTVEALRDVKIGNSGKEFPRGRSLRGVTGSVRAVETVGESEIFCISAGRYVYKFDATQPRGMPTGKIFLKLRPCSLAFLRQEEVQATEQPETKKARLEDC